jgi:hypothetical protein
MTFEEAIKKSIKAYFAASPDDEDELGKLGERKYTRQYFEGMEEEFLAPKDVKIKTKEIKEDAESSPTV